MLRAERTSRGDQGDGVDPAFQDGLRALAAADWRRAYSEFKSVVERRPEFAEAWEGLAEAAYWVPDDETILEARERAYHLYRERGNSLAAARMAGWLAVDWFELRGQEGVANGWLQRGQRLINGRRETPENTWLRIAQARLAFMLGRDASVVCRGAAQAAELARRLDLPDMEALSLSLEGLARLGGGDVRRAVPRLDEAAAIVLGREARDITAAAFTLCQLMAACERLRDFDRARQWCAAARQFSEDRGFPVVLSICRPHYGAVLMWRGHWPEAEEHLQIGSRELMEFMPPFAVGALSLLAVLRWRQGRWDEAEETFEQIKHEASAQVGIAELLAGKGEIQAAIDVLERHLRAVPSADMLERGPALELLVRCMAGAGELQQIGGYVEELKAIAERVRTSASRASAHLAQGLVAGAGGDWETARRCLGDAVELFEREDAPFEAARARIALAEALDAGGRHDAAAREAQIAGETLRRVGAAKEAERAARLLASIKTERSAASRQAADGLTAREQEILALLAQGRSNQEIAGDLVLSVRTVERHISNIYQKLELEGRTARTAAAAYAHRRQMKGDGQR